MMNIYKRPLFRQAGGPAAPMAMDMPAMAVIPPEMQAQVQQAEQSAAGEMEGYGRAYVDEMMTGLDSAESAEEVINAIRGNAQPIDSRYDELAGIVGIEDARATPESVLALVQPTIMMTEQGAMDTGIGELMQSLTGGVEMEDEQGMPTPMGQGVGELMMGASAAEPMPVQQYYMGGPVVKMQLGGDPNSILAQASGFQAMTDFNPNAVRESYDARKDLYEELLGDTENRRKQAQSSLFFDIAKAGLNLAGGVDPSTGQSMTGAPLGAQIARAAMPVAESAQRAGAEVTDAQRGARVAALQSAEAEQAARIAAVTGERRSILDLSGRRGLLNISNDFEADQRGLDRQLTREEGQSERDLRQTLSDQTIAAQENMTILGNEARINEILTSGEIQNSITDKRLKASFNELVQRGEIEKALSLLGKENTLEIIGANFGNDQQLILDRLAAEKQLIQARGAEDAQRILESHRNQKELLGITQDFEEGVLADKLEFDYERLRRTAGGGGGGWFTAEDPTSAQLAADLQDFTIQRQTQQDFLLDQYRGANLNLEQDRLALTAMGMEDETARYYAALQNQSLIAALRSQQNKLNTFGNSVEGVAKDLISDMGLMQDYATGKLDRENPQALGALNTAISYFATPTARFNQTTGQFEQQAPIIPSQLRMALDDRKKRNLPQPFANGGEVRKFQRGGAATSGSDFSRVDQVFNPEPAMTEQDIELPGRIIPETPNLTPGVGLSTALSPVRTVGSYARELGITDREAPFSEIADAQTQLTSLANVTQRFVRESVGGRALKDEVEALAAELGKPGFATEEATLEKLTNMRNQLLEVEDLATSILETPEKFTTAQVTTARQDVRRLSPLIENYDRAIMNFETALNPNKPDPAMFEGR
jgi:hypothetical protein